MVHIEKHPLIQTQIFLRCYNGELNENINILSTIF